MIIRSFVIADEEALVALGVACDLTRAWNDPRKDIERKRADSPELFLVGELEGELVSFGKRLVSDD